MFQYRQVLVRLRAGDTVREIARSGLMGRDKLGALSVACQCLEVVGADTPAAHDGKADTAVGHRWRARRC